jgi:hypothetical protein
MQATCLVDTLVACLQADRNLFSSFFKYGEQKPNITCFTLNHIELVWRRALNLTAVTQNGLSKAVMLVVR